MLDLLDPNLPTPDDIFGTRFNAKLTQQQAADLIGYSRRGWQDAENGRTKLHPAAWALFLLTTGYHPTHQCKKNPTSHQDQGARVNKSRQNKKNVESCTKLM